jgi:hypothetical protein
VIIPDFSALFPYLTVDCDVVVLELLLRAAARGLRDDITVPVQEPRIEQAHVASYTP